MKKRLWWSMLLSPAALMIVTSVTAFADRPSVAITSGPGAGRAPDQVYQVPARIPATSQQGGGFRAFEGFFSTNNLSSEQYLYTPNLADMAAGPQDVLTIVNRRISRYPNPNTLGNPQPPAGSTFGPTQIGGVNFAFSFPPTNEALIDSWLGETVLGHLCPTQPRSTISCLIDHASVRYDQMQGRFVVLASVVDTGVQFLGSLPTAPRKASWVLIISKFASFTMGNAGSSDLFIAPTPPLGTTGGINTANWTFYYGAAVTSGTAPSPTPDGFGATLVDTGAGAVSVGNVNALPGIAGANTAGAFDCGITAISTAPTSICYFPTSARLGLDNDNLIIVSSVVNANLLNPGPTAPAFGGNRIRVIKKTSVYQSKSPLVAGNQFATAGACGSAAACRSAGDYYDLYATTDALGTQVTAFAAGVPNSQWTVAPTVAPFVAGNAFFCEPAHVRGRPAASWNNQMVNTTGAVGVGTSQNYVECIQSVPAGTAASTNLIYVQGIQYFTVSPINPASNTTSNPPVAYYPTLLGDGTTTLPNGMQAATVNPFTNPTTVSQAPYSGTSGGPAAGTPAPVLYVGDDRPQRVVFREGHLYDARAGASLTDFTIGNGSAPLVSTVLYDVLQKLTLGAAAANVNPVLRTQWYNGQFYAPTYDTPANVSLVGSISPINVFPYLEKLFVGTTAPALTTTDSRLALATAEGKPQFVPSNCTNPQSGFVGGTQTTGVAWPGLFDMHCGMDPFDTQQAFRDPVTGAIVTTIPNTGNPTANPPVAAAPMVSVATRGGASTDPNNGSLWNFGIYSTKRFAGAFGAGQWATYAANYDLAFPSPDPYNNPVPAYTDVTPTSPDLQTYLAVQIMRNVGLADTSVSTFNPGAAPTRAEMARLTILSLMDEQAITNYLNATGGCGNSFADVTTACTTTVTTPAFPGFPLKSPALNPADPSYWRYIETMYRRGITKGCSLTGDARRNFCPDRNLTRGEMAVFLIRAKFSNVFPTVLNGCPSPNIPACGGTPGGDNFGLFIPSPGYFSDVPITADQYIYVQKMFELRISNGTQLPTFSASGALNTQGLFSPNATLTKGQLAAFVVRAFFY